MKKSILGIVLAIAVLFAPEVSMAQSLSYDAPTFSISFPTSRAVETSTSSDKTTTQDNTSYSMSQYIQNNNDAAEAVFVGQYASPRDVSTANLDAALNRSLTGVGTVSKEYYRIDTKMNGYTAREVAVLVQTSDGSNLVVYIRDAQKNSTTLFIEAVLFKQGSSSTVAQSEVEAFLNSIIIK